MGPPQRRSPAESRRRAEARLCEQFRTFRLVHPRFVARGCIGGLGCSKPTVEMAWAQSGTVRFQFMSAFSYSRFFAFIRGPRFSFLGPRMNAEKRELKQFMGSNQATLE